MKLIREANMGLDHIFPDKLIEEEEKYLYFISPKLGLFRFL